MGNSSSLKPSCSPRSTEQGLCETGMQVKLGMDEFLTHQKNRYVFISRGGEEKKKNQNEVTELS